MDESNISYLSVPDGVDYIDGTLTRNKLIKTTDAFSILPVGAIISTFSTEAPYGFLFCNGDNISRTEYSELFSLLGTSFGSGDGKTTFTLPNLTGRFIKGTTDSSKIGSTEEPTLPNLKGCFTMGINNLSVPSPTVSGNFLYGVTGVGNGKGDNSGGWGDTFTYSYNASRVSSAYRDGYNSVKPDSIRMSYIIRAF